MADTGGGVFYGFPQQIPEFFSVVDFAKYFRPTPGENATRETALSIRLPIPSNLVDSYNMEINTENFDLLASAANAINQYGGGAEGAIAAGKSAIEKIGDDYSKNGIGSLIQKTVALTPGISDTGLSKFAQAGTGMVRNPHLTSIFDGVKLKTFQFEWKLSPKSREEASTMREMITTVKKYMHPTITAMGFALEYPYLARVRFETGESKKLMPNVGWSFLTGFDVNTTTGGIPSFYTDGQPTSITIQMAFQEINIRTSEDF